MDNWFTSDWHLGHENIVKHCGRPFSCAKEMNALILDNFNSLVKKKDRVYFLGDFSMQYKFVKQVFGSLPGKWFMIRGNHDEGWWNRFLRDFGNKIEGWWDLKEFNFNKQKIIMCHYPMSSWKKSFQGSWHLHGHSHGNKFSNNKLRMDVGVDVTNFKPINLDDVFKIMNEKIST